MMSSIPDKHTARVKILTWNTWLIYVPAFFLPDTFLVDKYPNKPEFRISKMTEAIKDYDIIGLQEVFNPEWLQLLLHGGTWDGTSFEGLLTEFPYYHPLLGGPPARETDQTGAVIGGAIGVVAGGFVGGPVGAALGGSIGAAAGGYFLGDSYTISGGLVLLSKYQIVDHDYIIYDDSVDTDTEASKGVLYAMIKIPLEQIDPTLDADKQPSTYVNVFLTHTQAYLEHHKVRYSQLVQLSSFVGQKYNGHPSIIMGDLNVIGDRNKEYQQMMQIFSGFRDIWGEFGDRTQSTHGYTWDGPNNTNTGDQELARLDYILLFNDEAYTYATMPINSCYVEQFKTVRKAGTPESPTEVANLSDHYGVSAEITFQPTELKPKAFYIDPQLRMHAANKNHWAKRSLYEYGRFLIIGFREELSESLADIVFLYKVPIYWQEGYRGPQTQQIELLEHPLLHHVNKFTGKREIYVNPNMTWVDEDWPSETNILDWDPDDPAKANNALSLPYALLHMTGHALGLIDLKEDPIAVMGGWNPSRTVAKNDVFVQGKKLQSYLTQNDIWLLHGTHPEGIEKQYGIRTGDDILSESDLSLTDKDLTALVEGMLDDITLNMQYQVPWSGTPNPRLIVTLTTVWWGGNDDNWDDRDEPRYYVRTAATTGSQTLKDTGNVVYPGPDDHYHMKQKGDHRVLNVKAINVELTWEQVVEGIQIHLYAKCWEIDHVISGGKNDWFGEDWGGLVVNINKNHRVSMAVGRSGWAANFVIQLIGHHDIPNLYLLELDRAQTQADIEMSFKSGAQVTKVANDVMTAFSKLDPEHGGQPYQQFVKIMKEGLNEDISATGAHLKGEL